jgi:hypothetical protein
MSFVVWSTLSRAELRYHVPIHIQREGLGNRCCSALVRTTTHSELTKFIFGLQNFSALLSGLWGFPGLRFLTAVSVNRLGSIAVSVRFSTKMGDPPPPHTVVLSYLGQFSIGFTWMVEMQGRLPLSGFEASCAVH